MLEIAWQGKRRELRIFLQTKAVSTEPLGLAECVHACLAEADVWCCTAPVLHARLMMRIMSYADYKMTRHSPMLGCLLAPA